jgi:hypothetical protein
MEVFNATVILALWIFILAKITIEKKTDSEQLKTAKRIARYTLTGTLLIAIVFAAFALYLDKTGPYP